MKYAEKYPNATSAWNSRMSDLEKEGLLYTDKSEPCLLCKEPTHFIDIASEAPFCSEECMKKFYDDMSEKEKEDLNATYKLSIIFENLSYDQMMELQENIMDFKAPDWAPSHFVKVEQMKESDKNE